jgi:beta-glucanase (GH16 family)
MKMLAIVAVIVFVAASCDAQVPGYKLVWADEFEKAGLPDSAKWSYDVGGNGWGNKELEYYTKGDTANAVVRGGKLFITAKRGRMGNNEYSSARMVTKFKGDWLYGRIEVRAMLPAGRGMWPAIWMLPTDWKYGGWPASGEIDIMENVGYMPDSVFGSAHTKTFNHTIHTGKTRGLFVGDAYTAFHTYAVEWDEKQIRWFVDDNNYFSFANTGRGFAEWPFDQRFHVILNVAVGGGWGGQKGVDDAAFPASMVVDYVRVYKSAK